MHAIIEPHRLDHRSIQDLMTRIDAAFPPGRGRLVGFIASGAGEGTSTVAQAYARGMVSQYRRRVLLLDAGAPPSELPSATGDSLASVLATLARRHDSAHPFRHPSVEAGASASDDPQGAALWQLLPRAELWMALRAAYDEVVIDLPAAAHSRLGLAVAPYCDGVAVVLEAERTRAPVVDHMVSQLRTMRARVLGAVLNRRRFHLPQRVYRLL